MKSEQHRLFIALPAPAAVREELGRLQAELHARLPGDAVRWTRPEQIHLTLRFLGNVPDGRIGDLTQAVTHACAEFAPFQARAERLGFFPQARVPRVIWAWVHDDWGQLPRLQQAVSEATAGFTQEREEKGFTGHLTIGRAGKLNAAQASVLAEAALDTTTRVFGDWTAASVQILRSELLASGSRYTKLAEIPFTGNARQARA